MSHLIKLNLLDFKLVHHFDMKKILQGFIFFFFIFNLKNFLAQVAYIDINFILNNSEVGKSLNNFLKVLMMNINKIKIEMI